MVLIFGKEQCPYTSAAVDDYSRRDVEFEYIDVKKDRAELERMLGHSGGHRRVPVIVDEGKVTIAIDMEWSLFHSPFSIFHDAALRRFELCSERV